MLISNIRASESTFFSQERFIRAVARAEGNASVRVLKLQSTKSPAYLFGLERVLTFNRRSVSLAPFGLYAYPVHAEGSDDCVSLLTARLKTFNTVYFDWNVRFDHGDLANQLEHCGLHRFEDTTHVLSLDRPYEVLFKGFSQTTRNQIRRAKRKGVVVSRCTTELDVAKYYSLYTKMVEQRGGWTNSYNETLFAELFALNNDVIFLTAKLDNEMIGGGWYIRDGHSLFYWQGAINYDLTDYFPYSAIIDCAIRFACNEAMKSFNMGGSGGRTSLEQFKSFWGAQKVPYWTLVWQNPVWSVVSRCRARVRARCQR